MDRKSNIILCILVILVLFSFVNTAPESNYSLGSYRVNQNTSRCLLTLDNNNPNQERNTVKLGIYNDDLFKVVSNNSFANDTREIKHIILTNCVSVDQNLTCPTTVHRNCTVDISTYGVWNGVITGIYSDSSMFCKTCFADLDVVSRASVSITVDITVYKMVVCAVPTGITPTSFHHNSTTSLQQLSTTLTKSNAAKTKQNIFLYTVVAAGAGLSLILLTTISLCIIKCQWKRDPSNETRTATEPRISIVPEINSRNAVCSSQLNIRRFSSEVLNFFKSVSGNVGPDRAGLFQASPPASEASPPGSSPPNSPVYCDGDGYAYPEFLPKENSDEDYTYAYSHSWTQRNMENLEEGYDYPTFPRRTTSEDTGQVYYQNILPRQQNDNRRHSFNENNNESSNVEKSQEPLTYVVVL